MRSPLSTADDFNPRSPCGERHKVMPEGWDGKAFQSTLPVWGATRRRGDAHGRGEISIHAPRVGSDSITRTRPRRLERFQSTLPVWGATIFKCHDCGRSTISIHAPRVGSDDLLATWVSGVCNFNPRSPCGERLVIVGQTNITVQFQSTLPVWGATRRQAPRRLCYAISIHAPRVGSDASPAEAREE